MTSYAVRAVDLLSYLPTVLTYSINASISDPLSCRPHGAIVVPGTPCVILARNAESVRACCHAASIRTIATGVPWPDTPWHDAQ